MDAHAFPVDETGKPKVRCWEHRGCEGLTGLKGKLSEECPHGRTDCYSPCTIECQFAQCSNPWHKVATDFNLLLDTEGRIKNCSLKEIVLPCNLHLDNESGPVGINAFHIDQSILLPRKWIDMLLLNIGKILDVMLGNKFFQKHNEKILVRFRAECPFEPMVHDDSGISPDNR